MLADVASEAPLLMHYGTVCAQQLDAFMEIVLFCVEATQKRASLAWLHPVVVHPARSIGRVVSIDLLQVDCFRPLTMAGVVQ